MTPPADRTRSRARFVVLLPFLVLLLLLDITMVPPVAHAPGFSRGDSIPFVPRIMDQIDPRELLPLLRAGTLVLIHRAEEGVEFATGIVLIEAPLEDVWNTVVDYPSYGHYVPNIGQVQVVQKPAADIWHVKYQLRFKVLNMFSLSVGYLLEQHYIPTSEIWGIVPPGQESDLSDVRFREYFIDDGSGNTIFVYTAYADLRSYGYLAKVVYDAFPELATPTLVSVGTLFPEAVKERIERIRLNTRPERVRCDSVALPESLGGVSKDVLAAIPPHYRMILFHNPSPGGVRFATGLARIDADIGTVSSLVKGYDAYPQFIPFIKSAMMTQRGGNRFSVKYTLTFRVIFPLDIDYTLDYIAPSENVLCWQLDKKEKHDIDGEWGRIELIPAGHASTLIAYTSYSHLASGGFFMKLLLKHIEGFDMGLRVAATDMVVSGYKRAAERKAAGKQQ